VQGLLARYGSLSRTALQAVGYREVIDWLQEADPRSGEAAPSKNVPPAATIKEQHAPAALAECIERVKARTRQFARRQETWFRSLSECRFVPMNEGLSATEAANRILQMYGSAQG
jgi:tRNA dimethylallyltransferase